MRTIRIRNNRKNKKENPARNLFCEYNKIVCLASFRFHRWFFSNNHAKISLANSFCSWWTVDQSQLWIFEKKVKNLLDCYRWLKSKPLSLIIMIILFICYRSFKAMKFQNFIQILKRIYNSKWSYHFQWKSHLLCRLLYFLYVDFGSTKILFQISSVWWASVLFIVITYKRCNN